MHDPCVFLSEKNSVCALCEERGLCVLVRGALSLRVCVCGWSLDHVFVCVCALQFDCVCVCVASQREGWM